MFLQRFNDFIRKENLFQAKDSLLVTVSGGLDSVVLTELIFRLGYSFGIAHCNFQLRGNESERDKEFVHDLANQYHVDFHTVDFDTKNYAKENKLSIQEAARILRYAWFEEIRMKNDYQYILTAHHADDNIETVLMNFFRGTGIKGLRGIEAKHDHIIRPLLFARRKELEIYLKENQLKFVSDTTNMEDDYSRNFFRLNIIPFIEKIFPDVSGNILANINRFTEVEELYNQAINIHKKQLLEYKRNEIHLPVLKLKKAKPLHSIIYEIIKDFGFRSQQVDEVIALLESESGKYLCSPSHRIIKNRGWLIIVPLRTEGAETIVIDGIGNWEFGLGNLELEFLTFDVKPQGFNFQRQTSNIQHPTSNYIAFLDADEICFPIILRPWNQGDYFYPLGMRKKKKLSRFFIDQKFSKTDKEKVWVLEMNKRIIWLVGIRLDERFKVTEKTKKVLRFTFSQRG